MSSLTLENKLKLHDAFVRAGCHVGVWTHIEHFEFGTSQKEIEKFFKAIERVDDRILIEQLRQAGPLYYDPHHPN